MLNKIKKDLQKLANPKKAEILQRFFKTGKGEYGEGDMFLGIVVPEQRQVVKKYKDAPFSVIAKLLASKIHEHRLVGVLILVEKFKRADKRLRSHPDSPEIPRAEGYRLKRQIFDFYLKNTARINNWDLVDLSAPAIGQYLLDKNTLILVKLAKSKNLWERRIAIMFTYAFIRENKFSETFKIAEILLNDEHDLIHKAVGWMLREAGNRDLAAAEKFLKKRCKQMPRTMLRYAIEKFSEPKRRRYLAK